MSNINKFKEQPWHSKCVELSNMGFSGRQIAKTLGRGKSQINEYLKHLREKDLVVEENKEKKLNILYFDLESSLMGTLTFGLWNQNISGNRITKFSHLLSNSWAFNDEEPQGVRLDPKDVEAGNDLLVVVDTIRAIEKSDLIISFNGKRFDVPLLKTRALAHGLPPIKFPPHLDLMQEAKKNFRFPSNSMQNISLYLGEHGKLATSGRSLWERCYNYQNYEDCDQALADMLEYGLMDITATRDLHKRLQGWFKSPVNIGMMTKEINGVNTKENHELLCPHCSSKDVDKIGSKAYTSVSAFDIYRCGSSVCRGLSRSNAAGTKLVNYTS